MTQWRRRTVQGRGTAKLNAALDAGEVTVHAAFLACRFLSKPEQDAALAAKTSRAQFSRTMRQVENEHSGRTIRVVLSEAEWALIKEEREAAGRKSGDNGPDT
jgi:hypothetical protein